MRFLLLCLAGLIAGPVCAQQIGARDGTPERLGQDLGADPEGEEMAAIAAADAFPLGSRENPVRVGGPEGVHAYIGRLRCADGSQPRVGSGKPQGVGAFGTVVDGYELDCGKAAPGKRLLVTDMYHSEHSETRAPPGFTFAPR